MIFLLSSILFGFVRWHSLRILQVEAMQILRTHWSAKEKETSQTLNRPKIPPWHPNSQQQIEEIPRKGGGGIWKGIFRESPFGCWEVLLNLWAFIFCSWSIGTQCKYLKYSDTLLPFLWLRLIFAPMLNPFWSVVLLAWPCLQMLVVKGNVAIPAANYRSVFRARAGKCPTECFLSGLGTWLGVPHGVLFECFLAFFLPQKSQKTLKKHSVGHSEPGAQTTQKALRGALSAPGPKSTPVNGGRDRKGSANQKFRKGVGGQRVGARNLKEVPLTPLLQAFFLPPFSFAPLAIEEHNSGGNLFAVFWALLVANPLPPTPFRNLLKEAYTTTTETKPFGELFWPFDQKSFPSQR